MTKGPDHYIRTLPDGSRTLMVRYELHRFVAAEYALKMRMIVGGRILTPEAVSDMMVEYGDRHIAEAA